MKNRRQKNVCVIIALLLVILSCIFVGTSKSVYAKTKNGNDVKELEKIISVQKKRGAKVSTNLNNKKQYQWNKKTGRLQGINWHKKKLKGKISFNKLNGLKSIYISKNKVTKIYVDKLKKLEVLKCTKNKLKKINVKRNKALWALNCSNNKLEKLNVIKHKKLEELDCSHNRLKKLKFDKSMQELFELDCSYNKISSIHIDGLEVLEHLDCSHNNMKKLVLKNLGAIFIYCEHNKLKYLDFSNLNVIRLNCSHNKLESLETYDADWLNCSYNNIKELKANRNSLTWLKCDHNQLTNLDIVKICDDWSEALYCQNNNISLLDFTGIMEMKKVVCDKNVELIGLTNRTEIIRINGIQTFSKEETTKYYPTMFENRIYNNQVAYSFENGILTVSGTGVLDNSFVNKYQATDIKKVVVKDGIVGLADRCLQGCYNVSSIEIPESVTEIGNRAICANYMKEVTIPKSVKKIGERALGDNDYDKVTMPATVEVDYLSFEEEDAPVLYKSAKELYLNTEYNPKLKNVFYAKNIHTSPTDKKYKSINGYVYTKNGKTLVQVPALEKNVVIRKGCTTILASSIGYFRLTGDGEEFTYLNPTSITIPKTVKTVKDDLKSFSVTFSKRVKWKLKTNKLSGRSIETLCALMITKNETEFYKLKNAKIKQKGKMVITKDGVLLRYTGKASSVKIPKYVKRIGQLAFCGTNIKKVTLNKNLKYIGKSAFECCIFLKKVKWNKKLKRIEEYAFSNTDVKKKKFSKKTKVEKYAFWNG
ncbi:leucine-rich repeat protein [uncultured Eubacterium sp.]|uniref:leucine-rich repeat protein n=1 Tax=uncultured Eubacterium sp. TaxID=165185 RepID=UPI0026735133|nr:leucine-rich repeat protein [uncultured Eubacterium sp.]